MNNADRKWAEREEADRPSPRIEPSPAFPLVWYPTITVDEAKANAAAVMAFLMNEREDSAPYCPECDTSFATDDDLDIHARRHG